MAQHNLKKIPSGKDFVSSIDLDHAPLTAEQEKDVVARKKKRAVVIQRHRIKKSVAESGPIVSRTFDKARSKSRGCKRERSSNMDAMDVDNDDQASKKLRLRCSSSRSRSRPRSEVVVPGEGLRDTAQKIKAIKLARNSSKKRNKDARRGESDRVIPNLKPKHLFSEKRGAGKTRRR